MGSYVPSTPAQRQEMLEAIGLHGLHVAKGLTGGDLIALAGQVHKHHVAQSVLGKVRDADHSHTVLGVDPLVGLGILQMGGIVHDVFLRFRFKYSNLLI